MNLSPAPVDERVLCLFSVFLAKQGLRPSSISCYLAAVRHLQIEAGHPAGRRSDYPRLQYVLKGISYSLKEPKRIRLPITADIMDTLRQIWLAGSCSYTSCLLWATACCAYFGFLRLGELLLTGPNTPPAISVSDVAIDSHTAPSLVRIFLRKSKTDPGGKGVHIFLGSSGVPVCPVVALVTYLAIRPQTISSSPLFVWQNGSPLARDHFVREVRSALRVANIDHELYAGHSFRIGAATSAALAGVPAHMIKALGRWSSEAFQVYTRTPREILASVAPLIARHPQPPQSH